MLIRISFTVAKSFSQMMKHLTKEWGGGEEIEKAGCWNIDVAFSGKRIP